ncbi:MAG: aminotransferase class III-fold pyridoxal phosphate-dependent enzyme [Rhodospirillales bacterium]
MVVAAHAGAPHVLSYWGGAVSALYGIDGTLAKLDGEMDLNFQVQCDDRPAYVLKVMRSGCDEALIDLQCAAIQRLTDRMPDAPLPGIVRTSRGELFTTWPDEHGAKRLVWMISHLGGECYANFHPKTRDLSAGLGRLLGNINSHLADFDHPALEREMKWDLSRAHWIAGHIDAIDDRQRRSTVERILATYTDQVSPALAALKASPIHNDANDYNVLVDVTADGTAGISGLIDFGDMLRAPRVCEVAIAGAYIVLDQDRPLDMLSALVGGYHESCPLGEDEIAMVYPLVLMRLAVSVVNAAIMKREKPDDPYVTISEAPAWRFLDGLSGIASSEAEERMRVACGLPVSPRASAALTWIGATKGRFAPVLGRPLDEVSVAPLSVAETAIPENPLEMTIGEAGDLTDRRDGHDWRIGRYAEPRLIYTGEDFRNGRFEADDRRTVHLGVDVFAPAGTPVHAPVEGVVCSVIDSPKRFDYGGSVVLEHRTPDGGLFRTLYGHLDPDVATSLECGTTIAAGQPFARLGDARQNGGWEPHLHFQLCLSDAVTAGAWPGVADPDDLSYQLASFPNPAALLNLDESAVEYTPLPESEIADYRRAHFAGNLKLSYRKPCLFLRGWKHYLFDEMGRPYLDAYNNVPHVGHAHPRIQAVAARQLKRLNSNTRYLHPAQMAFAEKLLSKLPERFEICFFVNSGSEGNELALRLARAHTGGRDMITPDHGYHGMTTGAIDISAYKFNRPGGVGQPDWVHLVSIPDTYRGRFRDSDPDAARGYADEIGTALEAIDARGGKLAGFIAETFPSVGGQIIPPDGYLTRVYEQIRTAGGVCIADEVQTGLGRLGRDYWAFEVQGVVPDIVVLGKPLGNGHPLGAVITTREIADSFANGIEFFSTFGGSNLSCLIGREVLQIVDDEGLQANADRVGSHLTEGLRSLMSRHEQIGSVRGHGLFIGVELVKDRESREPDGQIADRVVNRLRDRRILIGVEGPDENVLKIRPPLTIGLDDADMIIERIDRILGDT